MTSDGPLTPPEYLSPSSIATFKQCPLKFKYSRIDRMIEPPTEATLRGNFVHDVLENVYKLPANERTVEAAKDIARDQWDNHWKEQILEFFIGSPESVIRSFRWTSWWCIQNLWSIENPAHVEPEGLEYEVSVPINGVPVRGFIDRFSRTDNSLTISDYKTGKKPASKFAADRFSQLLIYAVALKEMGIGEPVNMELLYLSASAKLSAKITPQMMTETADLITSVSDAVNERCLTGTFEPTRTKLCNWCYFQSICPLWQVNNER